MSCRDVLATLRTEGPLTSRQISERSRCSMSSTQKSVKTLSDEGMIRVHSSTRVRGNIIVTWEVVA